MFSLCDTDGFWSEVNPVLPALFTSQSVLHFPKISKNNWLWVNTASDIFTIHWVRLIPNARQVFSEPVLHNTMQ